MPRWRNFSSHYKGKFSRTKFRSSMSYLMYRKNAVGLHAGWMGCDHALNLVALTEISTDLGVPAIPGPVDNMLYRP